MRAKFVNEIAKGPGKFPLGSIGVGRAKLLASSFMAEHFPEWSSYPTLDRTPVPSHYEKYYSSYYKKISELMGVPMRKLVNVPKDDIKGEALVYVSELFEDLSKFPKKTLSFDSYYPGKGYLNLDVHVWYDESLGVAYAKHYPIQMREQEDFFFEV